jgi:hypothetical protein
MRESHRDGSARVRCRLRFIMNGREQSFAKLADQTVGRVVLVTSTIPAADASERQELMIVPWPMRDFDVPGPESPARREAAEQGVRSALADAESNLEPSE